jgi:hypothetical protein
MRPFQPLTTGNFGEWTSLDYSVEFIGKGRLARSAAPAANEKKNKEM